MAQPAFADGWTMGNVVLDVEHQWEASSGSGLVAAYGASTGSVAGFSGCSGQAYAFTSGTGDLTVKRTYTRTGTPPDHNLKLKLEVVIRRSSSAPEGEDAVSGVTASSNTSDGGHDGVPVEETATSGAANGGFESKGATRTTAGAMLNVTTVAKARLVTTTWAECSGTNSSSSADGLAKVTYDP